MDPNSVDVVKYQLSPLRLSSRRLYTGQKKSLSMKDTRLGTLNDLHAD